MKKLVLLISMLLFISCMGDKEPKVEEHNTSIVNAVASEENILGVLNPKQQEVKDALDSYLEHVKSLNTDGIISYTYDRLFMVVNREMFRTFVNTLTTSPDLSITSFKTKPTSIGEVQTFNNGEYTNITYTSTIKLMFTNYEIYNGEHGILVLYALLIKKYGEENIKINKEERTVTITKEEKMIAIHQNNSVWKFLGDNNEYRRLYPRFLPTEILNNI